MSDHHITGLLLIGVAAFVTSPLVWKRWRGDADRVNFVLVIAVILAFIGFFYLAT
jgi:hypothetical protein